MAERPAPALARGRSSLAALRRATSGANRWAPARRPAPALSRRPASSYGVGGEPGLDGAGGGTQSPPPPPLRPQSHAQGGQVWPGGQLEQAQAQPPPAGAFWQTPLVHAVPTWQGMPMLTQMQSSAEVAEHAAWS